MKKFFLSASRFSSPTHTDNSVSTTKRSARGKAFKAKKSSFHSTRKRKKSNIELKISSCRLPFANFPASQFSAIYYSSWSFQFKFSPKVFNVRSNQFHISHLPMHDGLTGTLQWKRLSNNHVLSTWPSDTFIYHHFFCLISFFLDCDLSRLNGPPPDSRSNI